MCGGWNTVTAKICYLFIPLRILTSLWDNQSLASGNAANTANESCLIEQKHHARKWSEVWTQATLFIVYRHCPLNCACSFLSISVCMLYSLLLLSEYCIDLYIDQSIKVISHWPFVAKTEHILGLNLACSSCIIEPDIGSQLPLSMYVS